MTSLISCDSSHFFSFSFSPPLQYTVLDGGFSDNIPCFDSNTITVCPFAGEADICPRDLTAVDMSVDVGHTSFHVSEDNIFRLNHALNPMEPEMLLSLCEEGYNECLRFLHKKGQQFAVVLILCWRGQVNFQRLPWQSCLAKETHRASLLSDH